MKITFDDRWLPNKTSERSRVGQKLSDLTTQKVIVGILAILLIIPVFNIYSGLYGTYSGLSQGGLQMLHNLYLNVSKPPPHVLIECKRTTNATLCLSEDVIVQPTLRKIGDLSL